MAYGSYYNLGNINYTWNPFNQFRNDWYSYAQQINGSSCAGSSTVGYSGRGYIPNQGCDSWQGYVPNQGCDSGRGYIPNQGRDTEREDYPNKFPPTEGQGDGDDIYRDVESMDISTLYKQTPSNKKPAKFIDYYLSHGNKGDIINSYNDQYNTEFFNEDPMLFFSYEGLTPL